MNVAINEPLANQCGRSQHKQLSVWHSTHIIVVIVWITVNDFRNPSYPMETCKNDPAFARIRIAGVEEAFSIPTIHQ